MFVLSSCGSHLIMTADDQQGSLKFSTNQKKEWEIEHKSDEFAPYEEVPHEIRKERQYWTVLGGLFKGPTVSARDFFVEENFAIHLEEVEIITKFSWSDVFLGLIPGMSRRTVEVRARRN